MKAVHSHGSVSQVSHVVRDLQSKGVSLWAEQGQLRYSAPRGVLTQTELATLKSFKQEILTLLVTAMYARDDTRQRRRGSRVALSFSQVAHWHWYRLGERRTVRQIATALRLDGPLDIDALCGAVNVVVARHDALRTRIVMVGEVLEQEICEKVDYRLRIDDLTAMPKALRPAEAVRRVEACVAETIDVMEDPLFEIRLLRLDEREHVLILAMEHIISDMFSMNILVRDLLRAYSYGVGCEHSSMMAVPMQFGDYALLQRERHDQWLKGHGQYWARRLDGCNRVTFPADVNAPDTATGWGSVPVRISSGLKARLCAVSSGNRSTLVMGVFAAYAALVLRWCAVSDSVFQYVTEGRVEPHLQETIGPFAFLLSLRVEVRESDTFDDLMRRVTQEYRSAYGHADFAYIESQYPRPGFVRNAGFNWLPKGSYSWVAQQGGIRIEQPGLDEPLVCAAAPFEHPILRTLERDTEPFMLLFDTDEEILGAIHFARDRFSVDEMQRFVDNLYVWLDKAVEVPASKLGSLQLL